MEPERLFAMSGVTVLPWWALMILTPRWRWSRRIVASPLILLAPATLYALLVLPQLAAIVPVVGLPQLESVAALLGQPGGATVAWVHFLAFDLFVGRWIFMDAQRRGLSALLTSPILLLTLLLGPLGLLAHLVHRTLRAGTVARLAAAARAVLVAARQGSPELTAVALGATLLLLVALSLQAIDPRQVLGVSTWVKPAKFGASVAITALTMALLYRQLRRAPVGAPLGTPVTGAPAGAPVGAQPVGSPPLSPAGLGRQHVAPVGRGLRWANHVMAAMLTLELLLISGQAARGVASHFNAASTFDMVVFAVMGVGIALFWGTQCYVTWRAFRQPFSSPTLGWAIRLGLLIAVVGGALGFIMPRPTPAQLASLRAGQPTAAIGAHAVGVPDGGAGLPVTGWSTTGGDLRVPHFLGLHALQLLPLAGWLLTRLRRDARRGTTLVVFAGITYLGLVMTTLVQALRAQPLLAPDGSTVALLGASVAAGMLAAIPSALSRRRSPGTSPPPTSASRATWTAAPAR